MGCRLGLWGGPDGFGITEESAQKRIDLISGLCRDYQLALLKFDGVCGHLRPEKQDYFVKMMQECRKYTPDLILIKSLLRRKLQIIALYGFSQSVLRFKQLVQHLNLL
jgi:hypothetical protein